MAAGNDGDAAERGKRPPLQILTGDVFERLPARDHVDAIADFGISGDGAYRRILEPAHELRDRVLLEMGVGIERHHDIAARFLQTDIESRRLAAIGHAKESDASIACEMGAYLLRRIVGGAVVDDDDLQIWIVAGEDMAHCAGDDLPFVVGGNEHRLERRRLRQ